MTGTLQGFTWPFKKQGVGNVGSLLREYPESASYVPTYGSVLNQWQKPS